MKYTSVLDASEQSFQNLINDAEDFENDKIFASIRSRDYDESDINLINAEVRISIAKIDKEYMRVCHKPVTCPLLCNLWHKSIDSQSISKRRS